ncbi:MAG: hypothetical protein AVDCRST_MAG50-356 [uncultured Acidimicrobiales bacterium]|uniref:Sensor domain-containing protein n=1 Tax=uncultured Acidimicrobiales bacterium TaxID=310071 RepID=A0A6J4H6A0_9ACTN|nr:MAG: hypothetical protein AVDCRST_MAG50-356 [uncultured Acidimicrobiales bacterium]
MGAVPQSPGPDGVARLLGRARMPARFLMVVATVAALAGGVGGLLLWAVLSAPRLFDWFEGTLTSVISLVLLLLPAGWLVFVRFTLAELVELPTKLGEVARRRGGQLRRVPRPPEGPGGAARSVYRAARDYAEVTGGWGLVAQLATPWFWALTVAALIVALILAALAPIIALGRLLFG